MKIADLVYQFCAAKVGDTFKAHELWSYVAKERADISPESTNRTMRMLRDNGSVRYYADRPKRTYYVTGVC